MLKIYSCNNMLLSLIKIIDNKWVTCYGKDENEKLIFLWAKVCLGFRGIYLSGPSGTSCPMTMTPKG